MLFGTRARSDRPVTRRVRRLAAALAAAPVIAGVLLGGAVAQADPAPPNPSDAQIQSAMANQDQAAATIGVLSAHVAQVQSQIEALNTEAALKAELYNKAAQDLQDAQDAAAAAQAAVASAQGSVEAAQKRFSDFVRVSYMAGNVGGTSSSLLTATDPNAVLQQADLRRFAQGSQLDAIAALNTATVEKSNADAVARDAVNRETAAKEAASEALAVAVAAVNYARSQKVVLDAQLSDTQNQLAAAQIALTGLTDQRAAYEKWQVEEAARIEAERVRAAEAAAAAAAAARSGSSNVAQQVSTVNPVGEWTAELGELAVAKASEWVGQDYAWAGGNFQGPTYGVNSPGTAGWNDSTVYGFDCSGLVLYAWYQAAGLTMPHYAASQYSYGSVHPANNSLAAGDLLFYSTNGRVAGIHHVAMYIGGGKMIEAPFSGGAVRIVSVRLGGDYFGATRPLS